MLLFRLFALCVCAFVPLTLSAQLRDMHAGRLVLDDDANDGEFHRLFIGAEDLPSNMMLMIPTPSDSSSGYFLISNPTSAGGQQMSGPFSIEELRLTSSGTSFYSSFLSPAGMTANILYTLPGTGPSVDGSLLSATSGGQLGWVNPTALVNGWAIDGNSGTTPGTHFVGTTDSTALHIQVRGIGNTITNSLILNENSSIQRDSGGDPRGLHAVDLQMSRSVSWAVASANHATISGGHNNLVANSHGSIGGGEANRITGPHGTIGGGRNNNITDSTTQYATISGGGWNLAIDNAFYPTIGGGFVNQISGNYSTIGGGSFNRVYGSYAVVSGGQNNNAYGRHTTIPGGNGLTLDSSAHRSFGFLVNNNSGSRNMIVSEPEIAVFGNADLWLANNNNAASELRFYEANSTTGAFPPAGTNYSAFKAGSQSADIIYTLPTALPATDGQVLSSTTGGLMSWADGPTGAQSFTNSSNTVSTLTLANNAAGNDGIALEITGGAVVLSNAAYTANAATPPRIADDVAAALITATAAGAGDDINVPAGGVAGQTVMVANTSGVSIDLLGTAAGTVPIPNGEGITLLYDGTSWAVLR